MFRSTKPMGHREGVKAQGNLDFAEGRGIVEKGHQ